MPAPQSSQAPRHDLYGPVHKGLRRDMCSLLARIGSADFSTAAQASEIVKDLHGILELCAHHLEHENTFLHPAVDERSKGASSKQAQEHEEHEKFIAKLRTMATELEKSSDNDRAAKGQQLYLHFSAFVGENLVHMAEEEGVLQPKLQASYSDNELRAIEGKLLGSMKPEVMMAFLRGMIPAMNREERAMLLGGMKQGAPPEAFNAVLQVAARPTLSAEDYSDLTKRLGV